MRKTKSKESLRFAQIEYLPVSHLNPSIYNPRSITPEAFNQLKASFRKYGFVQLVVIQKDGYNIIGGHQSVRGIIDIYKEDGKKGVPRVPCAIVDLSEREAKLLNVALNKIRGDFDMPLLSELMKSIDDESELLDDEIASIGFSWPEIDPLIDEREADAEEEGANEAERSSPGSAGFNLAVKFDSKAARDGVRAALAARAARHGVSMGEVLSGLLLPDD